MSNTYGCDPLFGPYCSNQEIAIKQWSESLITRLAPKESGLDRSNTTFSWGLAPHPWEFYWFATSGKSKQWAPSNIWEIEFDVAKQLLTYNYLFSQTKVQLAFVYERLEL